MDKLAHNWEPTDTEGHSYCCSECGLYGNVHFWDWGNLADSPCGSEQRTLSVVPLYALVNAEGENFGGFFDLDKASAEKIAAGMNRKAEEGFCVVGEFGYLPRNWQADGHFKTREEAEEAIAKFSA